MKATSFGGERLAVVEDGVVDQVEDPGLVVLLLPGLREAGDELARPRPRRRACCRRSGRPGATSRAGRSPGPCSPACPRWRPAACRRAWAAPAPTPGGREADAAERGQPRAGGEPARPGSHSRRVLRSAARARPLADLAHRPFLPLAHRRSSVVVRHDVLDLPVLHDEAHPARSPRCRPADRPRSRSGRRACPAASVPTSASIRQASAPQRVPDSSASAVETPKRTSVSSSKGMAPCTPSVPEAKRTPEARWRGKVSVDRPARGGAASP